MRKNICLLPALFLTVSSSLPAFGAGLTFRLSQPAYETCGVVSLDGYVDFQLKSVLADFGDGTDSTMSFFPLRHRYTRNGAYTIRAISTAATGQTSTATVTVNISNAESSGCEYTVVLHPRQVILRDGKTEERLRLEIRDAHGDMAPTTGREVTYRVEDPNVAQVSPAGVVSSHGFGQTKVEAAVKFGSNTITVSAEVLAGHFRIEPPAINLAMDGVRTGQFRADVGNADGSPASLNGRSVTIRSEGDTRNPYGASATVDSSGRGSAVSPGLTYVWAEIGNLRSTNTGYLRVTPYSLKFDWMRAQQRDIAFMVPKFFRTADHETVFREHNVPALVQIGHELLVEMTAARPYNGDLQYMISDIGGDVTRPGWAPDSPDPTGTAAHNGNPTVMGMDVSIAIQGSVAIFDAPPQKPYWFIYFHELGHDFTLGTPAFTDYAGAFPNPSVQTAYIEAFASTGSLFAAHMMRNRKDRYHIPVEQLQSVMSVSFPAYRHHPSLPDYVAAGAKYHEMDANVLDEIIMNVLDEFGYEKWYRFWSIFVSKGADGKLPFDLSTEARQATFFVAGLSAAVGQDLRERFVKWGFPIDNAFFESHYAEIGARAAARDPGAYAGSDKHGEVNVAVPLDDAETFDWENQDLKLTWRIASQPQDSRAAFSDASTLHPSFTADKAGRYVLTLTAGDDIAASRPSTVVVTLGSGDTTCAAAVPYAGETFSASGGSSTLPLAAASACNSVPSTTSNWIAASTSSAGFTLDLEPNPSYKPRVGMVQLSGQVLSVEQAGTRCRYTVNGGLYAESDPLDAQGASSSFTITKSPDDCPVEPFSDEPWLKVTAEGDTVSYEIPAARTASGSRALITLPGMTYVVNQFGLPACALSVGSYPVFGAAAVSTVIPIVKASDGCIPVLWVTQPWVTSWVAEDGLHIELMRNPGEASRVASISMDYTARVALTQAGTAGPAPVFALSSSQMDVDWPGTSGTIHVTAPNAEAAWTAAADVNWIAITGATSGAGNASVSYTIGQNDASLARTGTIVIGGQSVTVRQAGDPNARQAPAIHSIVNAASLEAGPAAPGSYLTIYGENFTNGSRLQAPSGQLPYDLGGVRVMVNGVPAPVSYADSRQVNFQLPVELPESGSVDIEVRTRTGSGRELSSPGLTVPLVPVYPALYMAGGDAIVTNTVTGALVTADTPLRPGEYFSLWGTGFGRVLPPVPTGQAAGQSPMSKLEAAVVMTIDGAQVTPSFIGLSPGSVGVYLVNGRVPDSIPGSRRLAVTLTIGDQSVAAEVAVAP